MNGFTVVSIFLLVIVVMIDHNEIRRLHSRTNLLAKAIAEMSEVIKR